MKSKKLRWKILPVILLLALIVIVAGSCKKNNDDEPDVPPGPTPLPATPDVFSNKPLHLMSDDEINHHAQFPGHLINRLGSGLVGGEEPGILDPFKEIAGTLFDVYDYYETDKEYATINNGLSQIQQQITTLQNSINTLSGQLSITTSELEQLIITTTLNQYIADVQTAMDSTTINGLQYFPKRAAQFKAGQITQSQFNTDTANLRLFAYDVYHNANGMNVTNWSLQLKTLLCPSNGSSALMPLADLIIKKMTKAKLTDSVSVMNAYLMLEGYFMQVVNSQFQCATLYTNAYIFYNPADTLAPPAWFTDTFTPQITKEVATFLSVVDYMMVNLDDYRNQNRFVFDMQYANAGLDPDNLTIHPLARSQFIANLLYDALGFPSPVMCGHITIPNTYASIGNGALGVNIGGVVKNATDTMIAGQIPYTYWVDGNPAVCHPDYKWNVYRFGTLGTSDGSWPTTKQSFQVVSAGSTSPWVHYAPIQGSMTPLYYNPQYPNQTSTTKTAECNFEFAYFSANWSWGFLQLTNSLLTDGWIKSNKPLKNQDFDFSSFNINLVENSANVPFAATTNTWQCTYQTSGITWTNQYGTTGTMQASGTTGKSSHYYVIVDGNYLNVTTGAGMPDSAATLQGWAWSNANYIMKGSGGDDLTICIGTARDFTESEEGGPDFATIGDDVIRQNWHDQAGSAYNSFFGKSGNLKANTAYQPGVQYYYQTANLANPVTAGITFISAYQFVYGGFYSLPSK